MRNECEQRVPSGQRELAPTIAFGTLGTFATIVQMTMLSTVAGSVLVDHQHLPAVLPLLLLLLGAIMVRAVLAWREEVSAQTAALRLTSTLRERLIVHLIQLGPAFVQYERSGELSTTAMEGVDRLTSYYQRYLPLGSLSLVTPALIICFLLKINLLGALVLLGTAPVIPLLMVLIGSYSHTHVQRHWLALTRLGAQFLDTLQGLPTLLLFGRGEAAGGQVRAASEAFQERTLQVLRVAFLSGMVLDIMIGMAIGLVAVLVAIQLLAGSLSLASGLLVLLLTPECYRPLQELGAQRHTAMEGKAARVRIEEILRTPAPLRGTPTSVAQPTLGHFDSARRGEPGGPPTINFSGVTYRFQDKNGGQERAVAALPSAVAGITLTLAAGTRTALVGRSGAGKSTLVNLLLRFLDPDAGIITVSGVDLRELALDRWRARVALVPQQPHMFAGTIADNLLLARPEATQADLAWATEQAGASEFIARLPGGYATPVGEQGVLLSAGEVQRLAIARAFLKAAPVLILDEPTSALDPEHEAQVRHSLDRLMAGRTVLIVAHRRNTIVGADQIAALDGGRLVESGRYQELLERGGPDPKPPSLGRKGATTTGTTKVGGRILPSHTEDGATRAALASEPWLTGGKKGLAGCAAPVAIAPFPGREGGWGLGRLLALLGPHRGSVALALLLGVLTGIAGVGLLATGGYLVAAAALGTPILALGAPIALVRLFGVGRGLTRYAERLSAHRVTFALLTTLRVWCYHRLLPLTPARLGAFRSGDLLTRLVKDVAEMEAIYLRVGAPVVVALILSLLIVLLFAQFSLILAVVMAAYLVLAGVGVPWLVYRLSRTAQAQVVAGRAAMQAQVIDVLQGMADLLALGREFARDGAFNSLQQGLIASRQRLAQVVGLQRLLATFVAGGALWTVLILAIQLIDQQALQARYLPLLALVALVSFETVQPLGEAFTAYRGTTAAAERVYALIEAAPAVADPPRPRPAPTSFAIRFDRVSFAYQLAGPAALREVSFCLPAGSHVAIVGPSGSGKTTLVNLLVRFWDPDTGTIQLGGHDLRAYALNDLRRSIGVVSQRTTIFNATLRRNLLLARPEASDDELLRALERARLGDLVAQSPYGLDRWVGEQGVQLSGGERQRLAIARTLLLDAPVLVLDEPTANLDPVTEGELLAELAAAMAGRTTVTITHRLIGLEHMDEILVLDAGRIVERGTHGQLLERYGLYRRMLDAQEQFVEET